MKNFIIFKTIIFSSTGIYKVLGIVNILITESHTNKVIHDYAKKLKGCFDLENKNQRRINESLDLIKYCMKEFVVD